MPDHLIRATTAHPLPTDDARDCNHPYPVHNGLLRLFILVRHAESTANLAGVVSSDPQHPVALTPEGRRQARRLAAQLSNIEIDIAVGTRFLRTQQTLDIALRGRSIPLLIEPGFDEVRAGDCDGAAMSTYWSWKERHDPSERFPRGESINEALLRHAAALRRLLARPETIVLLVIHEFGLRHIAAAAASSLFPHPAPDNAAPYLFGELALRRASDRLEGLAHSVSAEHRSWSAGLSS